MSRSPYSLYSQSRWGVWLGPRVRMLFLHFAASSLLLLRVSMAAATYEVAQGNPNADDSGPGTEKRPFKTMTKAAEKAEKGDTVLVHDGIYRERVLFKTSGTEEQPITIEAAPGAHVVLTGADRLTDWGKVDAKPGVYQVPWTNRF